MAENASGHTHRCDVAVIGAGTAGLAAERAARRNGASTLLIDPEFNGTTCANVGCMPSKLLIAAAREAHRIGQADLFGIEIADMRVDGPAIMQRVRSERDRFAGFTREKIGNLPEGVTIRARARFDGPDRLLLDNGDVVEARAIVIATGSAPALPPPFAELGDLAITSDGVFELKDLPGSLAVVGSGAIGLELAQAFARLGVEVALFDRGETMGKIRCPRVHAALRDIIEADMDLHLGVDVKPESADGRVKLRWSGKEEGTAEFDKVLVAVGRPPVLDTLDLERSGLELDEYGVPRHDRATMRCGDSAIFIAGDVAADLPLLHEASHDGAIAGRNAAALPAPIRTDRHVAFSIIFTEPAIASIGKSEDDGAVTGTADFSDQGRARVEGRNQGRLTLYAAAPDGRLIGADMAAPAGEHLAHLLCWAIQQGLTATQLLEMPFYHPTIEEGLKQALRTICAATPIDLPADQDTGAPPGA
ncbi:dihydrolipoamide dehydrogenase [Altererythrobacter atlanticus]|uniref:Dihydrolipoyl dehydrogenase n=1 Tax=Croceibacterium atlanticum TaxID=1267766 RepID=A0A0F7KPP8_9SPHN|nr:dihydrolipoyl dehydrogenase [Croceibacterium atlanticum]AKH42498.1 Dihydrolipoyl dehydrogenase [Croceibacterium atlanticum]MBB5731275.1 dihydrolipoamide dehydrogenase [Croceibacterium atlanticum]